MKELLKTQINTAVSLALKEDIGAGDITTKTLINNNVTAEAFIVAKESGVLAGIDIAKEIFKTLNSKIYFKVLKKDGEKITPKDKLAKIRGKASDILTGERTALNFLQHLSGIATKTHKIVKLLSGSKIKLLDTRKTTPGLRFLEKYAVVAGGGKNHRFGLFDGVLIKDNHLKFCAIKEAVNKTRKKYPCLEIEVETQNLNQAKEALSAGADIIMLDNMNLGQIRKALNLINRKAKVEVSGKVTENKIKDLTNLDIDYISMGGITHSACALDIALEVRCVK